MDKRNEVLIMRNVFTFLLLLLSIEVFAQQRPEEGIWTTVNLPVNLSSRWQIHNDASLRTLSWGPALQQYLYRPGIRYLINPSLSLTLGTAFFFTRTSFEKSNDEFGYEFRTWQEVLKKIEAKHETEFQLRFRSEQRFFRPTNDRPEGRTANRYRLRGSVIRKICDQWSLQISEEYFRQVNFEKFEFDQNRVIITGIRHIDQDTQLQLGYMWLKWPESSQHIFSIGYQKKLNFYGGKH